MGDKVRRGGDPPAGAVADETPDGMQCTDHPYRSNPGGICAFCLQEKLGKLISSSKFSDPFFAIPPLPSPSSSSSSPSAKNNRRKPKTLTTTAANPPAESLLLKRSKSVAAANSPRKKSFWSFLTLSYSSPSPIPPSFITKRRSTSTNCVSEQQQQQQLSKVVKEEEASDAASPSGSQASSSFGRKVARSRSVGCGSRSFSGDFLERISNGFGDCTLRRVESHREAKQKASSVHRNDGEDDDEQRVKERIKCGGIFVGLGITTTYWLSATESVRLPPARRGGRSKSWAWAFASPMRAFRPPAAAAGGRTTIIAAGEQ